MNRHSFDARGARPARVADLAVGEDTGHQKYVTKFELLSIALSRTLRKKLKINCGSGSTAMRVSDRIQSRWNRSHKGDPIF